MTRPAVSRRNRLGNVAAVVLLTSSAVTQGTAYAQTDGAWRPSKPIELVAGSTAGGALDRTARDIQAALQKQKLVDVPVIVTNKPGAGSSIAWSYVARQRGDGHVLTVIIPGLLTNRLMGIGSVSPKDLVPVAIVSSEYVVFGVNSTSPVKTGRDLVATLRAEPAKLNIGIATALGGASHIAVAQTMKAAGVDTQRLHFIVYGSSADAVTALLGNHIDLVAASAGNFLPVMQGGRIRTLAITAPSRVPGAFASIPTWQEQGVNVVFSAWRGLAADRDLTPTQLRFWDDTIRKMAQSKEWIELIERNNERATYLSSSEAEAFLDGQSKDLNRTLTELGLVK